MASHSVVGVLGGQLGLDLLVLDQAALGRVDQEHAAGLEAALAHDPFGGDVEDADLAGQDDQAVVGDPVSSRAQAVAVEDGPDHGAVGEGDGGRPVPGLHERGVVAVEGPTGLVHGGVVLPGLGDHHEDGVGQRAPAQVQQLEHLVEGGRVARPRRADRVEARQVPVDQGGREEGLSGPHPVAVAGQGVDLPVVGQVAVRVGQGPAREGVGREAGVDQGQARLEAGVAQVGEERAQLLGREHALVDEGAGGQGREVEPVDGVLGPLAQDEGPALEGHGVGREWCRRRPSRRRHEDLLDPGHRPERRLAQAVRFGGHHPPPEDVEALFGGQPLDHGPGLVGVVVVDGQEGQPDRVPARRRQREPGVRHRGRQEPVRDLHQDPRPVARLHLGARGAPVGQPLEHGEATVDDVVVGPAVEVGHHADATGVVLVCRVVEASGHRRPSVWSERERVNEVQGTGTTLARRVPERAKVKNTRPHS